MKMNTTFSSRDGSLPKRSLSCGKGGTDETMEALAPVKASSLKWKSAKQQFIKKEEIFVEKVDFTLFMYCDSVWFKSWIQPTGVC
ncbi:hypothetical protein [Fictibacillus enclensis]|uniref:hypothetical protein n=1 Tax=Fictibacillus enclensis TaxID=1017270 RepID=UPI0024C00E1B|nr:hypothetical protein [Fictibacillus enclensis]WHY72100.1 hypothetical protein QNH15_24445 [Fictibacillus enclensis]